MKGLVIIALLLLANAAPLRADPCRRGLESAELAIRESTVDQAFGPCGDSRFRAHLRSDATIDIPNFYGTLGAATHLSYQHRIAAHLALNIGARLLDYRFAQNAVLTSDEVSSGPVYLGIAVPFELRFMDRPMYLAPRLRFVLPRSDSGSDTTQSAMSLSLPGAVALTNTVNWHARVYALSVIRFMSGGSEQRWGLGVGTDVAWQAKSWLGLSAGIAAQGGFHRDGLDHLAPQLGVRFPWSLRSSIDIGLALPSLLPGDERSDAVLRLGVTLGR